MTTRAPDRQLDRFAEARERIRRVREAEHDTLADLIASLDDATAARFAALHHASAQVDLAIRELVTAGSDLAERIRLANAKAKPGKRSAHRTAHEGRGGNGRTRSNAPNAEGPRGRTPTPEPTGTGEGSASKSAHPSHGVSSAVAAVPGGELR